VGSSSKRRLEAALAGRLDLNQTDLEGDRRGEKDGRGVSDQENGARRSY